MRKLLVLFLASGLYALAGQLTTAIGNGFANACAGSQYFGGMPNPGDGFSTTTDQYMTCNTATALLPSVSAADSGTFNGNTFNNSGTASAGVGVVKVGASNDSAPGVPFAGAAAYGGWNDQMTIGGGTGSGYWVIGVTLSGELDASAPRGRSTIGVAAYENHNLIQMYGTTNGFAYNNIFLPLNGGNVNGGIRNNVIGSSWDFQGVFYGADESLTKYSINRTVYFALPFIYGTPFEFGIYIGGVAGQGSSTAAGSASFDLTHTLTWAGDSYVVDGSNNPNPNFTLASQSGFDYSQAFDTPVPEPATAGSLVLALGAMAWLKRREAR